MEKRTKPSPCPFCGSEDVEWGQFGYGHVMCLSCQATGPVSDNQEEGVKLWNTRPEVEKLREDIAGYVSANTELLNERGS